MARPSKKGLDYYPLDVGFLRDKKVRLLRAEFGASSVLFVLYVLGKVYEEDGYFTKWDKDELLVAADELRESPQYISEVLQGCLKRSFFDEGVFEMFGVLTSAGIQRRYLRGCEKRDEIKIASEYWLLDIDDKNDVPTGIRAKLTLFEVAGGKNEVSAGKNEITSPGNQQSKVKESKVKESKVKQSKDRGESGKRFSPPTLEEVKAYCAERGNIIDPQRFYDYFSSPDSQGRTWIDSKGNPVRNWKQKVLTWEGRERGNKTKSAPQDPASSQKEIEQMKRMYKHMKGGGA